MMWLPDGEIKGRYVYFVSTENINVTDRQTPHNGISA